MLDDCMMLLQVLSWDGKGTGVSSLSSRTRAVNIDFTIIATERSLSPDRNSTKLDSKIDAMTSLELRIYFAAE
jgi:hypothetical protein